ncbi:hypothetical protein PWT90_01282 [Aphanocladium album]|nr:hypothetical protein PWT90_01282 [Aphanocladium album]
MADPNVLAGLSSDVAEKDTTCLNNGIGFLPIERPPLDEVCARHEVETEAILRLVWGVVLGTYTGASDISFCCMRNETACSDLALKSWLQRMDIDRRTPIMELAKQDSEKNSHQNGGPEDVASQCLALEECDSVLMLDIGMERISEVLGQPNMVNINIAFNVNGTTMSLAYRVSKLGSLQARSMAAAVGRILSTLIDRPLAAMCDLDLCDDEDVNILKKWNNVETTWQEKFVHHVILGQVAANPDSLAVDAWDGHFTYLQLDHLSSSLAGHLMDLGVTPETFVALCFEKSKWLVVSILAVIKAGGAYVVLEPYYPVARMTDICSQLQVKILLTSQDLLHIANNLSSHIVTVDQGSEYFHQKGNKGQRERQSPSSPRDALYVVFSSGSTGKPKGIIVEHAAFVSWGTTLRQSLYLDGQSRVLQFSSFAFLIAHRDVLLTLMFGGCVCMPSESQRLNHLETFISEYKVNWANLTPSVATLLDPNMTTGLKTLLLTSEPMSLSSLAKWQGKVNLLFAYGQSESVSLCCVRKSPTIGSDLKNVGRRVGRAIWLVDPDDHNKLVPVGAVGELVIQGPMLARGYLDSERTALVFLHDAAWLRRLQPGYTGRLYKTGDLAQFTNDGSVRYISRKDNSAKLYGQRLDLDEVTRHVERCLAKMSDTAISSAVVDLSHAPQSNDIKLIVFLGFNSTSPDTSKPVLLGPLDRASAYLQEFRSRLKDVVPRYMIPALVVTISHIPLNLSGKTDRKRLREILSQMTVSEVASCLGSTTTSHEAPRTDRELTLRSLWSQVLSTPESSVGRRDDFFRSGGDSLAAMKLVSAAHAAGLCLTFTDIFAHPQLSDQAGLIDSAERQKQDTHFCAPFELVAERRKQAVITTAVEKYGLLESQIEDIYPATPMQEGLIALNDLRPGSYVSQRVYRVENGVTLRKLEAAWRSTLDANPPSRTRLMQCSDDGSTYQVVVRGQFIFEIAHDLKEYMAQDEAKTMNLGVPLVRLAVICSSSKDVPKFFVVTMHHCIYDAWSMSILLGQVRDAYHGAVPAPQTFKEFVKYVHQSQNDSADHWKVDLDDLRAEQFPALPSQTHSLRTTEFETLKIRIPPTDASAAYITLATRLQLAWAVTVASYTGVDDVVFGLTVSGRAAPVARIDKMAGPTIATFPLRVQLRSELSILEELQRLQSRVISKIPFEHFGLHNISHLGDDAAKACGFQSLLVIQQSESPTEERSEILRDTEGLVTRPMWDTYALSILCTPALDGKIHIEAVYDATVVPKAQMRRILNVFAHILEQTVSSPHIPIADMDSVSTQDLQQIQNWNMSVPPTVSKCIHDIIHDRVVSHPEAIAIDAWDGQLTYKELDERSSRLAGVLIKNGLRQEIFVPLCMEKSKWVAVAILAVNKAGGAFILLDPSHPAERLAWICKNAQASLLLCAKGTTGLAAELGCQHVFQVDGNNALETSISSLADVHQPTQILPSHALCAIYTSGSTGAPKGIVIEHSSMATQVTSLGPRFGLDCKSRIFQFASHAFDVAVSDYLFGLAVGACICVPKEAHSRDNLASSIRECRANWTFLTPSVARTLSPDAVPELRALVLGGESAKTTDFLTWSGALKLLYVYGPAECTIYSTLTSITHPSANPVNVGTGISGTCWLVEPNNPDKLVAIGAVGELVVEGPLVARCYLGNSNLSLSSFISYPKWLQALRGGETVHRLYRTGDMFRYSPAGDGSLEFVGRKDKQVKLHGQRMELAEIEHHVSQSFPMATDAIVEIITPLGSTDQKMLVAFVWDSTNSARERINPLHESNIFGRTDMAFQLRISAAESELRKSLPRFMIPSLYIPLAQFPLTPNGKADRRYIKDQACLLSRQALGIYQSFGSSNKRPPSTESEGRVRQLAADVLRLNANDVGLDDNFFQLGGDSIKAMIMSTRAMDAGLRLAAADILAYPRLCDMAELTTRESTDESHCSGQYSPPPPFSLLPESYNHDDLLQEVSEQCEIGKHSVEDVYPCTPLQEGLFALTMKQPSAYVFKFTLQLTEDLDIDRFQDAWNTVLALNHILRTRIVCATSIGGSLVQAVMRKPSNRQYIGALGQYSVGLGKPLCSIQLLQVREGANRYNAVVSMHHALYDGVSLGLILKQLSAFYYHGEEVIATPYNCFIRHCLSLPADGEIRRFWDAELADATGSVFTAAHMQSYILQSPRYAECRMSIAPNIQISVPLSSALKLAWGIVLSNFTGESDAVFGTVVSGRMANMKGIDKVVGPTIATVPFRIRHLPTITIQEVLEEVQSRSLKMIPFEQTGLQRIRQLVSDACQFQSLLIVQFAEEEDFPESPLYKLVQGESSESFHTYPLTIVCTPSVESVHFRATFDADVIPARLVDRLLAQYTITLRHITENPQKSVHTIPSQSEDDAAQVWAWNEIVPRGENICVHEIINGNLAKRWAAPAVCAWDGQFTYEELEDRSTRLARHLTILGVCRGTMVPLCFEKSKWAVVATLAVLKAGGTFVPLDMSQAASRRETILARVKAAVILTSAKYAATLPATDRVVFAVEDASLKDLPAQAASVTTPPLDSLASSAAYIFFTSGSTGQPKGVVVDHCALSTSCISHGRRMGFNEQTRVLQFTSYTFDISLMEIFTTLIYGGCVCVPSDADRFNSLELSASNMEVNTLSLTASVARLIDPALIPSLETIIFVGENATGDDFKKWRHLPRIFNAYGPTECTIFCSINQVQVGSNADSVIGKAAGAVCWVVFPEDHDRLAPIGAVGELLVEGPVLAQGYLEDAEKTDAAFVHDPAWLVQGIAGYAGRRGRLYKTGDLVRYNEDGSLTYCGRKDTQVKIRGHRVELGEVECHLRDCIYGVNHAVVMAIRPDGQDAAPVLTAFLRFDDGKYSSQKDTYSLSIPPSTREALAERLPAYMIPSVYLAVKQLPLNTSGKMDRRQLQDLFVTHFRGQATRGDVAQELRKRNGVLDEEETRLYSDPSPAAASSSPLPSTFRDCSNETEKRIRTAWGTVLGLRSKLISIDDNFYDIGGDSIRVISLMRILQNEFGVRLGQSLLNSRNTTIRKIAEHADNRLEVAPALDLEGDISNALFSVLAAAASQPSFSPTGPVDTPVAVFLTGGTGFLGTRLLHYLLASTVVQRVVALVRATSATQGLERLKQTADIAGWWKDEYESRIEVWTGDLELSKLGLSDAHWGQLSGTSNANNIAAIIHNGAVVNWHMDYDRLRSANVQATTELLKAAAMSRSSPRFVFVSGGAMADLDVSPDNPAVLEKMASSNGYSQSKFVAESIVRRLSSQLPSSQNRFSVIKPGIIIGAADKGVANVDDFIWRIVATASRLRVFPEVTEDSWVPITDAGFVAAQTVAQILSRDIAPYFNVANKFGLGAADFWEQVNAELRHACQPVPWSVWVERALEDTNRGGQSHPLWPVQEVLRGRRPGGITVSSPLSPPDSKVLREAVKANVRYLGLVGFLETREDGTLKAHPGVLHRSAPVPALNL